MKTTKKLLSVLVAAIMAFAMIPSFGGAQTVRPLSEAQRREKLVRLESFTNELAEMISEYGVETARGEKDEYALARIVVKCEGELEAPGALAEIHGYNDWHIIQYATPAEAEEACGKFRQTEGVVWAEPDEIMTVCAAPGSSSFNSWGFGAAHINMYEYNQWLYAKYNNNLANMPTVIVAVVDTGADLDHPFLVDRLVQGYNVVNGSNVPEDGHSHGTHVCGTVVDGTFSNVKVMPIKVLSDAGEGTTTQVCLGMEYGYLHGADVENLSLGGVCDSGEEHHMMAEVIDSAYDNGTTVCVAAGNETDDAANHCPANVERACTVAAINSDHSLCYFSNTGALVDVAAPGSNIRSSVPGGGYGNKDGTSMACPHVAAVAAQIKSANPAMSADEVVSAIKASAQNIGVSNIGAGMLHLAANMYTLDEAANAAGCSNHFVSDGSYAWTVDGNSVVSGNAGVNNSTSTLRTELSLGFKQTITFDYKVSSEAGDYFRVKANGSTLFETSGETGWQTQTITVPGSGSCTLTFEFTKNSSGASGSDKAWVRGVKVDPSLCSAANITGGAVEFVSSGEYPWIPDSAENAAKSGNAGIDNSISVMTASMELKKGMIVTFKYKVDSASGDNFAFRFDGTKVLSSGATEGYVDYEYVVPNSGTHELAFEYQKNGSGSWGGDCAFVKCFTAYHSFESAVNGSDDFLPFDNEEEFPWFAFNDYASSSNWGENNSDSFFSLTLDMQQGETLSFRYRSSSESNYDFFKFYVDGTQAVQTSGNTSWTTYTFTASASRSYTFKWSFQKDYSADSYDDAAYVDDVVYSGHFSVADGDVNNDGIVDSLDAVLLLRYTLNLIGASELDLSRADVNGDGVYDSADVLMILRMAMDLQ